jgi:hypothetical protein
VESWELAAREEIRILVARYNALGDRGRVAELSDLFAPAGVLEIHDGGRHQGPAAIAAYLTSVAGANTASGTYWRHFVGTHDITVNGQADAKGTAYFQVLDAGGLNHWGRYRDAYQRDRGGIWHFAHRLVRTDGRATLTGGLGSRRGEGVSR